MTVRRCFGALVAIAAEALLAPASAVGGDSPTPATGRPPAFAALPASSLVSNRALQFQVGQLVRGGQRITSLAYRSPEGEATPVAVITSSGSGQNARVMIQPLAAAAAGVDARVLRATVLEHLYGLTMRQDPEGRFCLADGDKACDPSEAGRSHPEVLRELAASRAREIASEGQPTAAVPWVSVSLSSGNVRSGDADQVSVRIGLGEQPLSNTRVFFNRAPHSSCSALSDVQGVATCVLVDQHGDDGDEAHERAVPVLVTFAGKVGTDRVLLPTTQMLKAEP